MSWFRKKKAVSKLKQLEMERDNLERSIQALKTDKANLAEELEKLKLQHKIEKEDIEHMVKMAEERNAIELERSKLAMTEEKNTAIAKVQNEYRDKMEQQLTKETENIKSMYAEILQRLPNVNVMLGQEGTKRTRG